MSLSTDVKSVYFRGQDDTSRSVNTRYEIISGPCWLRGFSYTCLGYAENGGLEFGVNGSVGLYNESNGSSSPAIIEFGVCRYYPQAYFPIPDEGYLDFPSTATSYSNGLYIAGHGTSGVVIIENIHITVFYSQ